MRGAILCRITASIADASNSSEDGRLDFVVAKAGNPATVVRLQESRVGINELCLNRRSTSLMQALKLFGLNAPMRCSIWSGHQDVPPQERCGWSNNDS